MTTLLEKLKKTLLSFGIKPGAYMGKNGGLRQRNYGICHFSHRLLLAKNNMLQLLLTNLHKSVLSMLLSGPQLAPVLTKLPRHFLFTFFSLALTDGRMFLLSS